MFISVPRLQHSSCDHYYLDRARSEFRQMEMRSERGLQMSGQTDCEPCALSRDDQLPELHNY
ncbi:hypothetical protein N7501_011840 [Penicillium viridicatum]|nr:hypothetical protein N7501_011840 [Penicillium viridicatum]